MSKSGTSYDTRFLTELFYAPNPNQASIIRNILLASKPNYLSAAALSEMHTLSLKKHGKDVAELRTRSLVKDFHIVPMNSQIAIEAALIKHKHSIPFADSIIASTAKVLKVPCYTDDPHFRGIDGVVVKWFNI